MCCTGGTRKQVFPGEKPWPGWDSQRLLMIWKRSENWAEVPGSRSAYPVTAEVGAAISEDRMYRGIRLHEDREERSVR